MDEKHEGRASPHHAPPPLFLSCYHAGSVSKKTSFLVTGVQLEDGRAVEEGKKYKVRQCVSLLMWMFCFMSTKHHKTRAEQINRSKARVHKLGR